MNKSLWCVGAALLWAACNTNTSSTTNTAETATLQKPTGNNEEWVALFDGHSTKGWHSYGQSSAGSAWRAENGQLYLEVDQNEEIHTAGGGDLLTDEEFEDFHLKLEWKLSEGGNSGIIFYVHEDPSQYKYSWSTGLEMQILHNELHPDGKIEKHRAGDLYDLISASPESVKPIGEWNLVEIISREGKLDFFLNGNRVVSTTLWDEHWRQLIASSKFKDMPGFGTFRKGRIALQDHGDRVWFRNIQIRRL